MGSFPSPSQTPHSHMPCHTCNASLHHQGYSHHEALAAQDLTKRSQGWLQTGHTPLGMACPGGSNEISCALCQHGV